MVKSRFKKILKILLVFWAISMFFGFSISYAQAPTSGLGLSVSPPLFELDVFPGETISQRIKLGNKSDLAMPIAIKLTDFTAEEISGEMLYDESLQDPSIAARKWFEIETPNFILNPKESKDINFEIVIPKNAEPGGHFATMLFVPQLPYYYFKPGQPRTIPVVAALFLLSVKTFALEPEVEEKLEIVEFSLPREERLTNLENFFGRVLGSLASIHSALAAQPPKLTIAEKSPSSFVLKIKNKDIYHIRPSGKVLIYNVFRKKVGEAKIPQLTILPGKTRGFPVEFSFQKPKILEKFPAFISHFFVQLFFAGKHRAEIELEAKSPAVDGVFKPDISEILTFFVLPWKLWFGFILVFFLLSFLGVKYRKRIKLALKVLFAGVKNNNNLKQK